MEILQTIAAYGVVSVLVTGLVQFIKQKTAHPLIVLAVVSVVGGAIYAFLYQTMYWDIIAQNAIVIASAANLLYNILSAAFKK